MGSTVADPLLTLRGTIALGDPNALPQLSIRQSDDEGQETNDLTAATHLDFSAPRACSIPLDTPTRFFSKEHSVDLRSVFFAWQSKDVAIPQYKAQAQEKGLANLAFVERLDLITWLEGASDESEHIKALEVDGASLQGAGAAQVAPGAASGSAAATGAAARDGRSDGIYRHERRLSDRNSILRGIKPTDFSHIKKSAQLILEKSRSKSGASGANGNTNGSTSLPSHTKKPSRRPDPIILLSPSASSLLRMSNIKSFLDDGVYTQPDSTAGATNLLHIMRTLPSVDPNKALRFILVEGPEQFKPDYWNRVVAVFTTGQAWQFKSYKWSEPSELFGHVLGIFVGWKGDQLPPSVRAWGRGVKSVEVDKWTGTEQGRWRDREIVETLWNEIEENMRRKGWSRDSGPR